MRLYVALTVIRDCLRWSGYRSYVTLESYAKDCDRGVAYDAAHPRKWGAFGWIGGPELAAEGREAARRYRRAARVCRQIAAAQARYETAKKATAEALEFQRLMQGETDR